MHTPGSVERVKLRNHTMEEGIEVRVGIKLEINCFRGSKTDTVMMGYATMDTHVSLV